MTRDIMKSDKVVIFDLDDTLYSETDFFREGLLAVANYAEGIFGLSANVVYKELMDDYKESGRNKLFDNWLKKRGLRVKYAKNMIQLYRYRPIQLEFPPKNTKFLKSIAHNIYLITDGNKLVQSNKINSFGLKEIFKKCLITNQYGLKFQKPAVYSFDLVRKIEKTKWSNMIYVGDNPAKDFLALNSLGGTTIQTLEYRAADTSAHISSAHSAQYSVSSLEEVEQFI